MMSVPSLLSLPFPPLNPGPLPASWQGCVGTCRVLSGVQLEKGLAVVIAEAGV